jgi:hypothetical protein
VGHVIGEGNVHAGKGCPVVVDLAERLTRAKERFEESLQPVTRATVTREEAEAWGREFEASAVLIRIPREQS